MRPTGSKHIRGWLSLWVLVALLASSWGQGVAAVGARQIVALQGESARTQAADSAVAWLRTQQRADGSFSAGFGSAVGSTADVVTAAAALGVDALTWRAAAGQPTVLDYLAGDAQAYVEGTNAGNAGKLLVAVVAGNLNPRAFASLDLVALTLGYDDGAGTFDAAGLNQAWAILGLLAAREPLPAGALGALAAMQQADGGWDSGWGTDAGTTALALEALAAGDYSDEGTQVLADGLAYVRAHQSATGGFFSTDAWGSTAADADTTAICVQALVALGENPLAASWLVGGVSALDDLLAMQAANGGFEWQPGMGANLLSTLAALPALVGRPLPLAGAGVAIWDALRHLATVQKPDGSFESTLSASAYALLALTSADEYGRTWRGTDGASLVDYLASVTAQVRDAGLAGRLVASLAMADENPYLLGSTNAVSLLWSYYDSTTGAFDSYGNVWNQVLALWGLVAVGEPVPALAVDWLLAEQNADGGWGWGNGLASDTNSTALAMQALIAAGVAPGDVRIAAAVTYLASQQTGDAGFAWDKTSPWYTGPDSNSTALVVQGLLATDAAVLDGWDWARTLTATDAITLTVHQPLDRLLAFQLPSGAFEWQPGPYGGPNYLATVQAIPALMERAFPWQHTRLDTARSALAWLKGQQNADGSFGVDDPFATTLQAVLAGVTLGEDVSSWAVGAGSPSALDYLSDHVNDVSTDAGVTGKLLAVAVAADQDARSFGGVNLLARLLEMEDGAGQYAMSPEGQAWAIIGLAAARYPVTPAAVAALEGLQSSDGSWPGDATPADDTYVTALALQALAAAGVSAEQPDVVAGLGYLKARQTASGGFAANTLGSEADARATVGALQAILALGGEPRAAAWLMDGHSPLDYLAGRPLTGAGANVLTTALAVPALLLEINPVCIRQAAVAVRLPLVRGQ